MTVRTQDFVHRYVPPTKPDAPTLLLLHGTGGNQDSLIGLGGQLAPGAGMISPRGQVMEGGVNPRFFRRLAEGVFDLEDLYFRTHELADWLKSASAEYGFALDSLIAVGYSNGANIAASLLLMHPEVLKRAVLLRSMVPFQPEIAPNLKDVQVLMETGSADDLIPLSNANTLAEMFKQYGADVTHHVHRASHGLVQADLESAQQWIRALQNS